ncbi:hypothetical protein BJ741DRAFT_610191 [Chytriomyces cf. hyalinus JEL632]|nr:hypothetical protein BJ741DRAFT_610191 [Chytriomyces cf. hyalinus JEL632]
MQPAGTSNTVATHLLPLQLPPCASVLGCHLLLLGFLRVSAGLQKGHLFNHFNHPMHSASSLVAACFCSYCICVCVLL